MRDPVIWRSVIVEQPIDVIEPKALSILIGIYMGEPLNVTLTQVTRSIGHLLRRGTEFRPNQFWQPLKEKAAIYQYGDAPNSHLRAPEKKPQAFCRLLIIERAYSRGADAVMMAIDNRCVNTNISRQLHVHAAANRLH